MSYSPEEKGVNKMKMATHSHPNSPAYSENAHLLRDAVIMRPMVSAAPTNGGCKVYAREEDPHGPRTESETDVPTGARPGEESLEARLRGNPFSVLFRITRGGGRGLSAGPARSARHYFVYLWRGVNHF